MLPLALAFSIAVQDSSRAVPVDGAAAAPRSLAVAAPALTAPTDTTPRRKRVKPIEYSDWYSRRLTIHRIASYATIPLFVGQFITGTMLINKGTDAPQWVKTVHPLLADGDLALFSANTVTGLWNLWDSRADPAGRKWRTTHAILMLVADAGFAYTGLISNSAKYSSDARNRHQAAAEISGTIALVSYGMMLSWFRPTH